MTSGFFQQARGTLSGAHIHETRSSRNNKARYGDAIAQHLDHNETLPTPVIASSDMFKRFLADADWRKICQDHNTQLASQHTVFYIIQTLIGITVYGIILQSSNRGQWLLTHS